MSPSTERLVVFVTPAQKRVLAARAARLGISLSELVRRAVLAFDDTGEEVRAAGLVDKLSAAQRRAGNGDMLRRFAIDPVSKPARRTSAQGAQSAVTAAAGPADGHGATLEQTPDPADIEVTDTLPVAAAVALALAARAAAQAEGAPEPEPDPDEQARIARIIASESSTTKPSV
jgi:hypothetical protein